MIARKLLRPTLLAALAAGIALPAIAQDRNPAISGRQGVMAAISHNMGILGGMARGNTDYDAELASAAAGNIATLSSLSLGLYFPEGSGPDNAQGQRTRALPAIWEDMEGAAGRWNDLNEAATALAGTAGDGLEALQAGIGPVGQACGACHDDYRARN